MQKESSTNVIDAYITTFSSVEPLDQEKKVADEDKAIFTFFSEVMGQSTETALRSLNQKNKLENVAVFVDYDNVYWTLMNNYSHDPNNEDPKKNLFIKLWQRYGQDNVRTFRAYADFEKIKTQLTSLQKKRIQIRHVYSNGKEGDHRKNSSDIELCIDAIEHTYKDPSVSCYVFVTADSDMIPVISRMTYKSKRVELFYLSDSAPKHIDMTTFANYSEDLLSFLNVDVKSFELNDYVLQAIHIINDWHKKYGNTEYFLGTKFLKDQFTKLLSIPPNHASELLEKLMVDNLTVDGVKILKSGEKKSTILLTEHGITLLTATAEAASGSEQ